mgnify:FL=1
MGADSSSVVQIPGIIQARMSSSRLPGKVLLPLVGRPVIEHIVARVEAAEWVSKAWVATSDHQSDDPIAAWCEEKQVNCFRGSLDDVLDRFSSLAESLGTPWVLRVTGDCPVVDPKILDTVIVEAQKGLFDACGLHGDFPNGLDCTVFSLSALRAANRGAELPSEREHVGPYILNRPELFRIHPVELFTDLRHHRWTLDEPADYDLLSLLYQHLYGTDPLFGAESILGLIERRPWLARLNADIVRGEGFLPSLLRDEEYRSNQGRQS